MFRQGILPRIILTLVIAGLLVAGGVWLYRLGFANGYQTAAVVAAPSAGQGSVTQQAVPSAPYYGYGPWFYGPRFFGPGFGFFPFFPLFGIGFFLILFFLIGGLFRFWAFRRWSGGPGPGYWRYEAEKEWRERHGRPVEPAEEKPAEK